MVAVHSKLATMPASAVWLTALGVVPFAAAGFAAAFAAPSTAEVAVGILAAYGAVILSFLGGIQWGLAMASPRSQRLPVWLTVSTVPALVAWASLALPSTAAIALLGSAFLAVLVADHRLVGDAEVPPWFLRLRRRVTTGVVLILTATLLLRLG